MVHDAAGGAVPAATWPQPRGEHVVGELARDAIGRRYVLYLPKGFAAGQRHAMIVMLHGCTQDAADVARGTRMDEAADRVGFLVLYPEQPDSANPRRCWNWFDAAHHRRGAGEPASIADLAVQIAERYAVDADRVFIAGMSAGAAMASLVAAAYPDRFAGLALHSGLAFGVATSVAEAVAAMGGTSGDPRRLARAALDAMGERRRPVPVIVLQGTADNVVRASNAAVAAEQWFLTDLLARLGGGELPAAGYGSLGSVTTAPPREVGGRLCTVSRFADASGRTLVEEWLIDGLGHAWSGGSVAGTFTEPNAPDATAEIVRFFGEQRSLAPRAGGSR